MALLILAAVLLPCLFRHLWQKPLHGQHVLVQLMATEMRETILPVSISVADHVDTLCLVGAPVSDGRRGLEAQGPLAGVA
jgi:hypothetical protein